MKAAIALVCIFLSAGIAFGARPPVTVQELKDADIGLDWKDLDRGEIVWEGSGQREVNDAALVAFMAVKVRAPVREALEALGDPSMQEGETHRIDVGSPEAIARSLDKIGIAMDHPDLKWFLDPEPDTTFNASAEEVRALQRAVQGARERKLGRSQTLAAVAAKIRELLAGRFREYHERGVAGISPYQHKRDKIYPGKYLADAMEPMELLQERSPDFYSAFLRYPEGPSGKFEHQFYWSREIDDGRPILSLKHWMIDLHEDYALVGERKFYISHSLDTMNSFILLLKDGDHTLVLMNNQTFTQIVRGFGSTIAHKVGRHKVAGKIRPMFEALQQRFAGRR